MMDSNLPPQTFGAQPASTGRSGTLPSWLSADEIEALTRRSTWRAMVVFIPELLGYVGFVVLALTPLPLPVSILASCLAGLFIGVIFTVGHDACHQSLTDSKRLNDWIARIAFIPSIHAAGLWALSHNRIHHRFTCLKGGDYVWVPMSPEDYRAASPANRLLYRHYRAPFGSLAYYMVEMWAKKLILPIAPENREHWREYLFDCLFVILAQIPLVAAIVWLSETLVPERPTWLAVVLGWGLPFLFWNWLMGWIIYVHHTHPRVGWFDDPDEWSFYGAQILGTVHVRLPQPLDFISNNIMQHTAHHSSSAIPLYNLRRAQAKLRAKFGNVIDVDLTPAEYARIVKACKLFDFKKRCWTDFEGRPTGTALPLR